MKKFNLALGLLLSFSSFAALAGQEGGGGDAVKKQNKIVMRDFVTHGPFEAIKNKVSFLRSIPDFAELIKEIAEVDGLLAHSILIELLDANLFKTQDQLPLLPASQTTVSGIKAEVQIAVRNGNDIILGPEFDKIDTQQYLLIHEALHGLIVDTMGPMHHHRVRTLVDYLRDNRGKYNKTEIQEVLNENLYQHKVKGSAELKFFKIFEDNNIAPQIRCYALARYLNTTTFLKDNEKFRALISGYYGFKCIPFGDSYANFHFMPDMENYLNSKIKNNLRNSILIGISNNWKNKFSMSTAYTFKMIQVEYYLTYLSSSTNPVQEIILAPTCIFQANLRREQKSQCQDSLYGTYRYIYRLEEYTKYAAFAKELLEHLESPELHEAERSILIDYFDMNKSELEPYASHYAFFELKNIKNTVDFIKEDLSTIKDKVERDFKLVQDNNKKCKAKFKDL